MDTEGGKEDNEDCFLDKHRYVYCEYDTPVIAIRSDFVRELGPVQFRFWKIGEISEENMFPVQSFFLKSFWRLFLVIKAMR